MLSLPGTSLGVSHPCAADATPVRGRNPQGRACSWDHRLIFPPFPVATPEPALFEALQGGDKVTRLRVPAGG